MGSLPSVPERSVADVLRMLLGCKKMTLKKTLNRATSFMCRALDQGDWHGDNPSAREYVLPASEALYAAGSFEIPAAVPFWCATSSMAADERCPYAICQGGACGMCCMY